MLNILYIKHVLIKLRTLQTLGIELKGRKPLNDITCITKNSQSPDSSTSTSHGMSARYFAEAYKSGTITSLPEMSDIPVLVLQGMMKTNVWPETMYL